MGFVEKRMSGNGERKLFFDHPIGGKLCRAKPRSVGG